MAHGRGREAAVWRGSVRAAAAGPTPDEAWALLRDFCSLDRWVSSVETCRRLEGTDGQPGCVRYCAGPVNRAAPAEAIGWSKERLVELDPAGRSYSYEVVETNKGFGRYRATIMVEPDPAGCAVRWSFEAEPVQGWTLDGFVGFLENLARGVATRLEDEIMPTALVRDADLAAVRLESCANARLPPLLHARLLRRGLLLLPFHWNALTRAYLRLGSPRAALRVAAHMFRHGADPDRYTFPLALKAAAQAEAPVSSLRRQLHAAAAQRGLARHPFTESALISCYAKAGDLDAARRVFDENPHRGLGSWNAVISGLSQAGESKEALALFLELRRCGVVPDDLTMVSVASACCAVGDIGLAEQLHKCMLQCQRSGRLDVTLSNALVDMYAKCGRTDLAGRVFERMPARDVSSWTTIITGLATHGEEQGAVDMFDEMQREGVPPNRVTMLAVLCACAHGGLVDIGMGLLKQMEDGEIKVAPTVEHYGCVVDMLGRVGWVDEARALVERRMPMEANVVIWGTMLGACEKHGGVSVGEWAAERLLEAEPWNDGVYVVLSNIYAAAGMWGEVERVRKMMSERKVMKSPGCSL